MYTLDEFIAGGVKYAVFLSTTAALLPILSGSFFPSLHVILLISF